LANSLIITRFMLWTHERAHRSRVWHRPPATPHSADARGRRGDDFIGTRSRIP
jgi:hypothetical protein